MLWSKYNPAAEARADRNSAFRPGV